MPNSHICIYLKVCTMEVGNEVIRSESVSVAVEKVVLKMSSNSRITRSKGPSDGTSLPPYTRPRKDTSTKADNAGSLQPLTQQQTACDQLNSTVSHSPLARPCSRAGASTAPTTPTGMPSASASPFTRAGSHAGSA